MTPYIISKRNNNTIECSADLVITNNSRIVMLSLLDIAARTKKVLSDMLQHGYGSDITLRDREDVFFEDPLASYDMNFKYKLTRHTDGLLTHGIIYNTEQEDYIFDWEGIGLVKSLALHLRNRCFLPVTDEIVEQVLELDKDSYIVSECDVYTTKEDMKHLNVWYVNSVQMFKELLEKIDLGTDDSFNWDKIEDISDYLTTFVEPIKEKLSENIEILYDEDKIDTKINDGVVPFEGQIPLIQGGIETLKQKDNKFLYLAADPGVGKTIIGTKINHLYHLSKRQENYVTLAVVPATTLTQWKEEIEKSIVEDVDVLIIKSTNEFIRFHEKTKMKVDKPTYILVGKETFKLSYKTEHGVNVVKRNIPVEVEKGYWTSTENKTVEVCTCPDCGLPLRNPLRKSKTVFFTEKDFKTPKKSNYKCSECDAVLFQAVYAKNRKTSVVDYIKRQNIHFDSVIGDEIHESNNFDSIIGQSMRDILRRTKKSILLSGTVTNGYASSIYNILFALIPNTLKKDNVFEKEKFIKTYGTLMATTKYKDSEYHVTNRTQIRDSSYREIEGINPLVFTRYFAGSFIFASLEDIRDDLPELVEKYVEIEPLEEAQVNEYELIESIKKASPFNASFYDNSVVKHYVNNPFNWSEIPFIFKEGSDKQDEYVQPKNIEDRLLPKEKELIDILRSEKEEGRQSWVYCDFVSNGKYTEGEALQDRLARVITENSDLRVFVLKSTVRTFDRRKVIDKARKTHDVVISHPRLVSVGINLQWCTNYIFYTPSYHVNTVRQASLRGRRVNSTEENRVYHMYYNKGIEASIMERYKLKLVESQAIESKFVDLNTEVKRTASNLGAKIEKELVGLT